MTKFVIQGGSRLHGSIKPQGAKNEVLQILAATLLTTEPVVVHNIPGIVDVQHIMDLLVSIGVQVEYLGKKSYRFCAKHIDGDKIYSDEFHAIYAQVRGSIMLIAPLLARLKKACFKRPGGDRIGRRGIDVHLYGLSRLGVDFQYQRSYDCWMASCRSINGAFILLPEASVTGTANVIMLAVFAKGRTTIYHAACEPHVQQLCHMLVSMGAKIEGIGSNLLIIEGVDALSGTEHTIQPDMLEVGSFIGLAAITKSAITIEDVPVKLFEPVWRYFDILGIHLEKRSDSLYIPAQDSFHIQSPIDGSLVTLSDAVWPGFPADLISVIVAVAVHAHGNVLIHQKMFESRLFFVDYLIAMGAKLVLCDPHRVHIVGLGDSYKLRGVRMTSSDIRAGISLLISALAADGESIIENIHQIDRGYESIEKRLNGLGASIQRVPSEDAHSL